MLAFCLFLAMLGVSLRLVWTGWRGRRVGTAPHCKECEFDLSGLADDQTRCPECGTGLWLAAARVVGVRRRRPWRLGIGLAGMAACITVAWLVTQGKLQTSSVISSLPPGPMIWYAVPAGNRPLAEDMRWELYRRVAFGTLGDEDELQRLAEALLQVLDDQGATPADGHEMLMYQLAITDPVPDAARRRLALFLLGRALDAGGEWRQHWAYALAKLHDDGLVSAEEWNELIGVAATPRLWRLGDGPLAPGGEFLIGLEFLHDRLAITDSIHIIEFDFPDGSERVLDIGGTRWFEHDGKVGWSSTGTPGETDPALRALVRAPQRPGRHELGVRVLLLQGHAGDPDVYRRLRDGEYPDAVLFEDTLTVEVRGDLARPVLDQQQLGAWLRGRVLPRRGGTIDLALPPGRFIASGDLVSIRPDGRRDIRCSFQVFADNNTYSRRWTSVQGGSGGVGGTWGDGNPPAGIDVPFDLWQVPLGSPEQLIIVFKTLTLPDGRTHDGPEPIEVPVPPHPLDQSTSW